jgi:cell division protein FtsI/penicillin-binding protein 2
MNKTTDDSFDVLNNPPTFGSKKVSKGDDAEFRNFIYGSTKKKCGGISLPLKSLVSSSSSSISSSCSRSLHSDVEVEDNNSKVDNDDVKSSTTPPLQHQNQHQNNDNQRLKLLDTFLEDDKKRNLKDNWSKLDRATKISKLVSFVSKYSDKEKLSSEMETKLLAFLKECLVNKRLQRIKDVVYDKVEGVLHDIPGLYYNEEHQQFYLKHNVISSSSETKLKTKSKSTSKSTSKSNNTAVTLTTQKKRKSTCCSIKNDDTKVEEHHH